MHSQFTTSPVAEEYIKKHMTAAMRRLFFEPCATPEQSAFFHRYLLNHLVRTAQILERWGQSEDLCRAGAFHSLYGTEALSSPLYSFSPVALKRRTEVLNILGPHTEHVVYAFCAMQREVFLRRVAQPAPRSFFDRFQKNNVPLEEDTYRALLLLAVADWIEPAAGKKVRPQVKAYVKEYYRQEFIAAAPLLPPQTIQDLQRIYGPDFLVGQEKTGKERHE